MLTGYEERRVAFLEQGVSIIAGTVDSKEETVEVVAELGFPVAWGMTRDMADTLGAWWDERRNHIQPAEFVISRSGKVLMSTYSNSPVGRMDPAETLSLLTYLNKQRARSS